MIQATWLFPCFDHQVLKFNAVHLVHTEAAQTDEMLAPIKLYLPAKKKEEKRKKKLRTKKRNSLAGNRTPAATVRAWNPSH